jgi:CRISPR-associated protein Cmr3
MGWRGRSKDPWPGNIESVLGNLRDNLGNLKFQGPHIYSEKHGGLLLPAPLHLLGKASWDDKKKWSFVRLCPGGPVDCDLGEEVMLPSAGDMKGMKNLNDYYLKAKDFEIVLAGGNLNEIHPVLSSKKDNSPGELWELEYWVGLKRNPFTLTTEDRALFSKHHVRLVPGVSLLMCLEGPEGLPEPEQLLVLGGENRMAHAQAVAAEPEHPPAPELKANGDTVKFTLTHITPACLGDYWPGPNGHLPGVPGRIISACLERPQLIGGWDSVHRKPLPLLPYVPAGSTWFCEANAGDMVSVNSLHWSHIGKDTEWGFGQVALGSW